MTLFQQNVTLFVSLTSICHCLSQLAISMTIFHYVSADIKVLVTLTTELLLSVHETTLV